MGWTPFFITVLVIGLTLYDLVMVVKYGTQRSISRFIRVAWMRAPVVCFGCGFLCGHFCGPMLPETPEELQMLPIWQDGPADALQPLNVQPEVAE